MATLSWEEVISNEALIGGEIESQESGSVYRGPLREITTDKGYIKFECAWVAKLEPKEAKWVKWPNTSLSIRMEDATPECIGQGRIFFMIPSRGPCTIFPRSSSNFDPNKVEGLEKASARFLALYPDLPFKRETAEKVLVSNSFARVYKTFKKKPGKASMQDLLNCFPTDSMAEQFLWRYVEAVTGEKFPHRRVY